MKSKIGRSSSYLIRNPYTYCFRMNVPKDLQSYIGRKELRYSLKTGYLGIAKQKARYLAGHVQSIFRLLRKGDFIMVNLSDDQIKELVIKYIKQSLERINNWFNDEPEDDILPFTNEPRFYNFLSELDGIRQDLIANLNMSNFVMLENAISDFLKKHGVKDIDKNSMEYRRLCVGIHQAEIKLLPIQKRHMLNDFSYKDELPNIFPEMFGDVPRKEKEPESLPTPKGEPSPTLGKVIEELTATKIRHKKWRPNTIRNHQSKINTMLQVLGNKPVNYITKEDTKKLAKLLDLLPPGFARKKEYKDISDLNPKDLKGKHDKTMDMGTQRDYLIFARQVFSYAEGREYITKNPVLSIDIPPKKDDPSAQRSTFDDPEDLARVFNAELFFEWSKDHPSRFWLPLLALYTGCRLEEMASLYCEDVFEQNGLWCIDINDNHDKKVKNQNAVRSVPLHSILVDQLKFPPYVNNVKAQGNDRVFPDLKKVNNKYSHGLSKSFGYYLRKKVGITDDKKVFHSLRHNVSDHLYQKLVMESLVEELTGRAGVTETRKRYTKGYRVETLHKECISKLEYKVDLSHLKNSKYVIKD